MTHFDLRPDCLRRAAEQLCGLPEPEEGDDIPLEETIYEHTDESDKVAPIDMPPTSTPNMPLPINPQWLSSI